MELESNGMARNPRKPNTSAQVQDERLGYEHKLAAPRGYRHAISRDALLARILDEGDARVILLQAPAGHGKTTLLQQLQAGYESQWYATGWISIDESDNDVQRFYAHLRAMVSDMRRRSGPANCEPAVGADEFRSDWLVAQLLEIGKPVRIFLDDLHAVGTRSTLNVIREVLGNVPDGVQFVIASRTPPDIGIPRLVVNDQALVLRTDDLSFSREETGSFFANGNVSLSDHEIGVIHRQTEGWPAALQLYRLALGNPAIRQSLQRIGEYRPRELAEYLSENVLSSLPEERRDFLLKSAPLSRMSAELCDAVLGRSDSLTVLTQVEKAGLFMRRLSADGEWFVYHALFRAFLVEQLRLGDPGSASRIRRVAACWFRDRGYLEEALSHYSEAGDHSDAADVLEIWSDRLIPDAHLETVERWADRIPLKELEQRPGLTVKIVWSQVFLRNHQKMKPLLSMMQRQRALPAPTSDSMADPDVVLAMVAILEDDLPRAAKTVESIDTEEPDPRPFRIFELSAVSNARGYAAFAAGDFGSAYENFKHAREMSAPSGTSFAWAYSIAKSSLAHLAQGQLQEAATQLSIAMADPRMYADESVSQASLVSAHILALYEANDLDAAEARFVRFRDTIANAALHDYLVVAYVSMARIHDARGRPSKALELLDEADSICFASRWPRASTLLAWERVRREIVLGELDRALTIVEREDHESDGSAGWIRFSEETDGSAIGRIRLAVHGGQRVQSIQAISFLLQEASQKGWVRREIKLHILAAIAHWLDGSEEHAMSQLSGALRLASPGGFVRTFADEGPIIKPLLAAHALRQEHGERPEAKENRPGKFLLALYELMNIEVKGDSHSISSFSSASSEAFQPLEPFTKKETKILTLLTGYASNEDIAKQMHLSKDGVKYHIKNIYAKLAVSSRIQAIKIAKQMRLD